MVRIANASCTHIAIIARSVYLEILVAHEGDVQRDSGSLWTLAATTVGEILSTAN